MAKGAIAAGHPLTVEAGAQMLRDGGNAVDAAICAGLASFATESTLTGLGAGGFMLARMADGETYLYDFFVEAGGRELDSSSRADLVAAEVGFDEVPQTFNIGPASCGVPGTAAGLWRAAEELGTVEFERLIEPGVRFAREGTAVSAPNAYLYEILAPILTYYPETRALYAPDGHILREGDIFKFPDLADALERLAAEGTDSIYRSETTSKICDWVCERGGFLSVQDFANYQSCSREPLLAEYAGHQVLTNAPPSSGGLLIAFALDLLSRCEPAGALDDPETVALLAEVMEQCNRARGVEFDNGLRTPGFAERFRSEANLEASLQDVATRLRTHGFAPKGGDKLGSTTHLSVIDAEGNAAAITCSNGTGSGVLVPGTGIHLNNMLGEEDLNPLGFHRLEPGSRVTSMMAPTIVLRGGEVMLTLGSAGSNRLRSAILQVIRNVVDHGMGVAQAVEHGRIHYEAGVLHTEPGFSSATLDELDRHGYEIVRWSRLNLFFGGAQAVLREPGSGVLSGGGDPRRGGAATVVD